MPSGVTGRRWALVARARRATAGESSVGSPTRAHLGLGVKRPRVSIVPISVTRVWVEVMPFSVASRPVAGR